MKKLPRNVFQQQKLVEVAGGSKVHRYRYAGGSNSISSDTEASSSLSSHSTVSSPKRTRQRRFNSPRRSASVSRLDAFSRSPNRPPQSNNKNKGRRHNLFRSLSPSLARRGKKTEAMLSSSSSSSKPPFAPPPLPRKSQTSLQEKEATAEQQPVPNLTDVSDITYKSSSEEEDGSVGSSSQTTPAAELLTSLVCLSIMEEDVVVPMVRVVSMGQMFVSSQERMVRDALRRHVEFYLAVVDDDDDDSLVVHGQQQDTKVTMQTLPQANAVARLCLRQGDYLGATAVYQQLLELLPAKQDRAEAYSKLSTLCMAVGSPAPALQYILQAMQLDKENNYNSDNQQPQQQPEGITDSAVWPHSCTAAVRAMQVGLVHFGNNKVSKALKSWRQAMQLACSIVGYEHPLVAVSLCNIGVLHYLAGDLVDSCRALSAAVELQRTVLRSNAVVPHELSLFQMAITMGNLATAMERSMFLESAVALLDDSRSMLGSVREAPIVEEMEAIVTGNLRRILARDGSSFFSHTQDTSTMEETVLTTIESENDDASVDSARSSVLFGNSDGIPDRRLAARLSMTESDNHDFVILGPLKPEWTPAERVRETVVTWFGKDKLGDHPISFVSFDQFVADADRPQPPSNNNNNTCIPVDLDSELVPDAELRLRQIHLQAMKHLDMNEIDDALDLFEGALRSHQAKFGENHHLVGNAMHNMGMCHMFARQNQKALEIFEKAVQVRTAALGPDHPDVQASRMKIGLIHMACKDFGSAERAFWEVRDKYLAVLGYGHPQMAKIMNNIGVLACEVGKYSAAFKALELAYEYQRSLAEDRSEDNEIAAVTAANTLGNIAFVNYKQGKINESLRLYEEALNLQRDYLEENDPKLQIIRSNIRYLVRNFKSTKKSREESGCLFCVF